MGHWLMKTEPDVFGIDDLAAAPGQRTAWEGVRNYQARNFIRDEMKAGDLVFVYHSSCKEPGVVGVAEVVREAYPDPTAFDPASPYYDPKGTADAPRWFMVDIRLVRKLPHPVTLAELRHHPELEDLQLLRRGNRLSILPVGDAEWEFILKLAEQAA